MSVREPTSASAGRAATGISGLDEVLRGGFPREHIYLVEGEPGCGKTTLGMQFLLEGLRQGEPGMLVVYSETADEIRQIARAHGWDLGSLCIHEWSEKEERGVAEPYTLFHAGELELGESMSELLAEIERHRPRRLVFDAVAGLRIVSPDPAFYRRHLQQLRDFLVDRACTTLLVDDEQDRRAQTLVYGLLKLENHAQEYGPDRRRLRVVKLRSSDFAAGYHDLTIRTGGVEVFPRLVITNDRAELDDREPVRSGLRELDLLLAGGLQPGTSTLFTGPAGTGKSTLAGIYAVTAAGRGERSSVLLFDETRATWVERLRSLGHDPRPHIESGLVCLRRVDPAQVSPGELAHTLREDVASEAAIIVFDSLNGYLRAMSEERHVAMQLRELLTFLGVAGVTTLLTLAQRGMLEPVASTGIDMSYFADVVVVLRYFEARGQIRQALSVLKKRIGGHERTIRELRIDGRGVRIGEPLSDFSGVLTGVPEFLGQSETLLDARDG